MQIQLTRVVFQEIRSDKIFNVVFQEFTKIL